MKSLSHHLRHVRSKPHHVRKQIAFGTAFFVAALVGVAWVGASLATGAFAIKGSSYADSTSGTPAVVATSPSDAALAASPAEAGADGNQPPQIDVVDVKPTPAPAAEQTVIPF